MLKFPIERIVCLTEETVETIYLLNEQDKIVGVTGYAVRPTIVRKEKTRVSSFISAKIEKILALKPDIVFTFSDIQADVSKQLISQGLNVFCFNQRSIDEVFSMIRILGQLLDCSKKADYLVNDLKKNLEQIKSKSFQNKFKPRIYFEEWDDPLITGINWVSELIEVAGGEDIFSSLGKNSKAKNRVVTKEQVLNENPDIIISSWCGKKISFDKIICRKNWHKIKAVKNKQIYEIKSPIILQPGPAALTEGVKQIEKIINIWLRDVMNDQSKT